MLLSQALIERQQIQKKMEDIKVSIKNQCKIYEGDQTVDDLDEMLSNLFLFAESFKSLTRKINKTNNTIIIDEESEGTLADLIAAKDSYQFLVKKLKEIYDEASAKVEKYNRSDVKIVTPINLPGLRETLDKYISKINELNLKIQQINWNTDLIE